MTRRAAAPVDLFTGIYLPRLSKPERREVYTAIRGLRSLGLVVIREGRHRHAVYKRGWGLYGKLVFDDVTIVREVAGRIGVGVDLVIAFGRRRA